MQAGWLAGNALDLIKADLIVAPVVELGGAGRGVVGDHRRLLQRAAVLQLGRDAGGPSPGCYTMDNSGSDQPPIGPGPALIPRVNPPAPWRRSARGDTE